MISKSIRTQDKETDMLFTKLFTYLNRKLSDIIIIDVGDTTPSVKTGTKFRTSNTGAVSITQLDDGEEGQEITLITGNADTTTTVVHGTNFKLLGAVNWTPGANEAIKLVKSGSWWIEIR